MYFGICKYHPPVLKNDYLINVFETQALQQHNTYFGELKAEKPVRKEAALNIKQTEIIYNLGLALLHAGQPVQAFQSFTKCLPGKF